MCKTITQLYKSKLFSTKAVLTMLSYYAKEGFLDLYINMMKKWSSTMMKYYYDNIFNNVPKYDFLH